MIVKMLVGISRSDGFSARIGQEIDVDDALAQELMTNEQAEPVDVIKLPRVEKATAGGGGSSGFGSDAPSEKPERVAVERKPRKAVTE